MIRSEASANVRRVHSLMGALPLLAYVVFHLWEASSATVRPSPTEGTPTSGTLALVAETVLVLVPLLVHAGLGLWIAATSPANERYGDRGSSILQRITGVIALLFIAVHLAHTWIVNVAKGVESGSAYGMLWADLGKPFYLVTYVIGLTAICFHLGQGSSAFVLAFDKVESARGVRFVRALGFVFAFVLWVIAIDTVARFGTGDAFIFRSEPDVVAE